MNISRQINLTAISLSGDTHTLTREFKGCFSILKSYFMTMTQLVNMELESLPAKKLFIVGKFSYYAKTKGVASHVQ